MAAKTAEVLNAPSSDKLKALQLAMDKIEKDHGKGTIMRMGDTKVEDVAFISSGSIGLDVALGVGGYPRGRVIEIFGPESSGKTTLAIHAIAEAQKAGGIAAFIDAEHAFEVIRAVVLLKFSDQNLRVKLLWPFTLLPKHKKPVVLLHLLMLNMLSTAFMLRNWV